MDITNKYHNSKIYQITDIAYTKCYIGSTTESLSLRMARHRHHYKQFLKNNKNFISSYELFKEYGVENCKIELIEYYKCDTSAELRKREGEHIKNNDCINKRVEGRTGKEYKQDNKDKIREYREQNKDKLKEYGIEYRENNKDKINEWHKENREKHKEKIFEQQKKYREKHKDKIKEYREQNKDKINERMKEYREKNKDKINEQRRERYKLKKETCDKS